MPSRFSIFTTSILLLALGASPAWALSIFVGQGGCTLHDAIRAANLDAPSGSCPAGSGADTVFLPNGSTTMVQPGGGPLPIITTPMTIRPVSLNATATIIGFATYEATLEVRNTPAVSIDNLRIIGGRSNLVVRDASVFIDSTQFIGAEFYQTNGDRFPSGGIQVFNGVALVENSTFTSHWRTHGGVDAHLFQGSAMVLLNSTLFHDFENTGSRIIVDASDLALNNTTIWADIHAHGILSRNGGTIGATNSLFVGYDNLPFCRAENSIGEPIPFNLDQNLANLFPAGDPSCGTPLAGFHPTDIEIPADNGGITPTARLRIVGGGNPAINAGDNATCESTDQRGFPRGSDCDVGAFEVSDSTDLAVSMTRFTPAPYYVGQTIQYDVVVSNHGPADAYEVELILTLTGSSISHYQTAQDCVGLRCDIDAIGNGGSVLISVFVIKDSTASFNATATVDNSTPFSTDPNLANNIDNTGNGGTIVAAADLEVTQELLTAGPYFVGQALSYEVRIRNLGPSNASNVGLTHDLVGLSPVSYVGCSSSSSTFCTLNSVLSGGTATITFNAIVSGSPIKSIALVDADQFDPDPFNNEARNSNSVASDADLKVAIVTQTSEPLYSGQFVQFQITIINNGPDPATNVRLSSLAEGLIITDGDNTCTILPCVIPLMNNQQTLDVDLAGYLQSLGPWSHRVTVESDQNDPNLVNSTAIVGGTVSPAADVEVLLSLAQAAPYYVGDILNFQLTVRNNGSAPASEVLIESLNQLALELLSVDSLRCNQLPCTLSALEVGAGNAEQIAITARITDPGQFRLRIRAIAETHDTEEFNNAETILRTSSLPLVNLILRDGFESPAPVSHQF